MYKSKNGKVIASLTEVKNKTGDIFALVDEFGEVILTSYNKPRYRIVKIGVADILEENSEAPKKIREEKVSVIEKMKSTITKSVEDLTDSDEKKAEDKEEAQEKSGLINAELIAALSKLKIWESDSKKEISFAKDARKALQ